MGDEAEQNGVRMSMGITMTAREKRMSFLPPWRFLLPQGGSWRPFRRSNFRVIKNLVNHQSVAAINKFLLRVIKPEEGLLLRASQL